MRNFKLSYLFLSAMISAPVLADDEIKWFAQDYKPYSYMENSEAKGLAIDVASNIMKEIGASTTAKDIDVRVFSKFFIKMNDNENTVFFPIAETEKRKDYFKFVGPIVIDHPVLIAPKKNNIVINSISDINNYRVAAIEGYYAVQELTLQGVASSVFSMNTSDNDNIQALIDGNVDMAFCDELSCLTWLKQQNKISDYQVVYSLKGSNLSFAFAKYTSDDVVQKVQNALDLMKQKKNENSSVYEQIIKKYEIKW